MEEATTPTGDEEETARLLHSIPLFERLDGAALAQIARHTRRRTVEAGRALFYEGDPGETLFVVVSGQVNIQKGTEEALVHLARRGPGEHFGELALLDGRARMADAVAATRCDLLLLDREPFAWCLENVPKMALPILASLAERLREAADGLERSQTVDVLGRVAAALLAQAEVSGVREESGAVRLGAVTHRQIADEIGASRETVSRAIASLRQSKALRSEGRALVIVSLAKLRRYGG